MLVGPGGDNYGTPLHRSVLPRKYSGVSYNFRFTLEFFGVRGVPRSRYLSAGGGTTVLTGREAMRSLQNVGHALLA